MTEANVAAAALMPETTARQHIEQLKAKMAQLDLRRENLLKTKPSVCAHTCLTACPSRAQHCSLRTTAAA